MKRTYLPTAMQVAHAKHLRKLLKGQEKCRYSVKNSVVFFCTDATILLD